MTVSQDAARLRQMADEVAAIAGRLVIHIPQNATREHAAINAHAATGGAVTNLRVAAGLIEQLNRELVK